jgi:large subunit ribosomal protein L15
MLSNKRTKASRMRGSMTHGGGHKKKRRGAGNRGGKGFSGTGARGDQKNPSVVTGARDFFKQLSAKKGIKMKKVMKNYVHFGKKGFKSKNATNEVLSLNYIEVNFDKMVEMGLIAKDKNEYIFDATSAGYDKILGKSKFSKKITIICNEISQTAQQRVEEAGGKVIMPQKQTKDKQE